MKAYYSLVFAILALSFGAHAFAASSYPDCCGFFAYNATSCGSVQAPPKMYEHPGVYVLKSSDGNYHQCYATDTLSVVESVSGDPFYVHASLTQCQYVSSAMSPCKTLPPKLADIQDVVTRAEEHYTEKHDFD